MEYLGRDVRARTVKRCTAKDKLRFDRLGVLCDFTQHTLKWRYILSLREGVLYCFISLVICRERCTCVQFWGTGRAAAAL